MKPLSLTALAAGLMGLAMIVLIVIGPPAMRKAPVAPPAAPAPAAPSVSAAGITLTSERIDLPADDVSLPEGKGLDTVMANCTACHSTAMIATQPALTRDQWTAIVTKMKTAYRAPVADSAVPGIVDYLVGFQAGDRVAGSLP